METARVELKMENTRSQQDRIVAQVTLNCNGTILRGEERAPTINAAIVDVLESRVRRLKGKLYRSEQFKKSGRASSIKDPEAPTGSQEEDDSQEMETQGVLRVKRFPMKPMPKDEAIHQMELLGDDFFFSYITSSPVSTANIVTSEYS